MTERFALKRLIATASLVVVFLGGCSSGPSAEAEGVKFAKQACAVVVADAVADLNAMRSSQTVPVSGEPFSGTTDLNKFNSAASALQNDLSRAAGYAASAANKDPRWDVLNRSLADWAAEPWPGHSKFRSLDRTCLPSAGKQTPTSDLSR